MRRNFGLTIKYPPQGRVLPDAGFHSLDRQTASENATTPVLFSEGFSFRYLAPDHTGSDQYPDHAGNENCVDHVRFLFAEDRKEAALLFAFKCGVVPVIVGAPLIIGWLLFFA